MQRIKFYGLTFLANFSIFPKSVGDTVVSRDVFNFLWNNTGVGPRDGCRLLGESRGFKKASILFVLGLAIDGS